MLTGRPAPPPPPLELCLCLDVQVLRHLHVEPGQEQRLKIEADVLRVLVEQAHPSICDRPVVSAYLREQAGRMVVLTQEHPAYVYRLLPGATE